MKKWILLGVVLLCSMAVVGCGGSSGSSANSTPTLTVSDFAGSWYGQGNDGDAMLHNFQIDVDVDGNVTGIYIDGINQLLDGTLTNYADKIFSVSWSDGGEGGLISDSTATHAFYVDDDMNFAILQKGADIMPDYAIEDFNGSWSGYSIQTDVNFEIVDTGATSGVIANALSFSGDGLTGPFAGNLYSEWQPYFGVFVSNVTGASAAETGQSIAYLSADKTVLGTYICGNAWLMSFPACTFSLWERQ